MKFLVVLALVAVVCLPSIADAYVCDGCDLDGSWRTSVDWRNNDDESIAQDFDGQVRWRDEFWEFLADESQYRSCLNTEGNNCGTLGQIARESCKEARPGRVYNYRFERDIDDDDFEVRLYLHRGFHPTEDAWDRYCRIRNSLVATSDDYLVMVEHQGQTIGDLKGAVGWRTEGLMDPVTGGNCRAIFRPKFVAQMCMTKNDVLTWPTEYYCAAIQSAFQVNDIPPHNWGGAQTHARYGCDQYTWDSDSNDDNIHEVCNRMYFVNKWDSQSEFQIGHVPGSMLVDETFVETPFPFCEYRISGPGWFGATGINKHPCQ